MKIVRVKKPDRTLGILIVGGMLFETLELPWLDNKKNVSCIPDGSYPYKIDHSNNKNRDVIEILEVPDRSQIQIHSASKLSHLAGCVGVRSIETEALIMKLAGDHGVLTIKTIDI